MYIYIYRFIVIYQVVLRTNKNYSIAYNRASCSPPCAVAIILYFLMAYKTYDGHRSCIDHFMISATLQGFVKSVSGLDSSACCNDMGHFPILITLNCDIYTKNDVKERQKGKCKKAWHKISNYDEYVNTMNHIIGYSTDIYDLPSLQCSDRNCKDRTHRLEIDQVCTLLTDVYFRRWSCLA